MGQRHQLFVIAKINNRYRCLAAIHHQWLYGHTALRRCLGTLEIFQAVANRLPLQQELIAAAQLDDEFWTTETEPADSYHADVRFPFTMTCLVLGASFSSSDGYHHSVMVEPFTMKYNQGDNNNGKVPCFCTASSYYYLQLSKIIGSYCLVATISRRH